jgi:hypothetical protein
LHSLVKARGSTVDRGNGTRPHFSFTGTIDVFRVPAGFNFDDLAVNIIREDFCGMTSFADSEIEMIPGAMMDDNVVIIETVHCWTPLMISNEGYEAKAAAKDSDITPIINTLNRLGNAWCCLLRRGYVGHLRSKRKASLGLDHRTLRRCQGLQAVNTNMRER